MNPSSVKSEPFWIGAWRVQPMLNRVEGPSGDVQLEPRVMDVLCCLAAQAGAVVTRETLLATVWADVVVGEDPLNRAISTLRKVFGDDPRAPAYIETIRKVGYRLIVSVEPGTLPTREVPALVVPSSPFSGDGAASRADFATPPRRAWPRTALLAGGVLVVLALTLAALERRPGDPFGGAALRPVPLTSLPGLEVDPALSPDGSRVAYAWDGGPDGSYDLYLRTIDEAPPLRLTEGPAEDRSPTWSPDGQALAFIRRDGEDCAIVRVPALGGRPRRLAPCMDAEDLVWGPDGALAFADRPGPATPYRLFLLDAARPEPRPLSAPPASARRGRVAGDRHPAFSPDGQHLAFVRSAAPGLDHLYTVSLAGGAPQRHSEESQRIRGVVWPEPDVLVYGSDLRGSFGLFRRSLSAGTTQWIVGGGDGVHHPTVRGGHLVYEERTWHKNVWAAPLDGGLSQPSITSTRWDHSADVASDGKVVFVSNRSGSYEVWLWSPTTERAEALTDFGGPTVGRPRWSPDGRHVAFDVRAEGRSDVYRLDLDGGLAQRMTEGQAHALNAAWSPDGQSLFYASDQSGDWELWERPIRGGAAVQRTRAGGYVADIGPEGRWLYYTKAGTDGLWRQPLAGGPETQVTALLRTSDDRNWAITEQGLFLILRGEEAHRNHEVAPILARLDPDTGAVFEISRPSRPVANLGLALSADGQSLLYVQVDESDSDLMHIRGF